VLSVSVRFTGSSLPFVVVGVVIHGVEWWLE
jgi:hypothetical protein